MSEKSLFNSYLLKLNLNKIIILLSLCVFISFRKEGSTFFISRTQTFKIRALFLMCAGLFLGKIKGGPNIQPCCAPFRFMFKSKVNPTLHPAKHHFILYFNRRSRARSRAWTFTLSAMGESVSSPWIIQDNQHLIRYSF